MKNTISFSRTTWVMLGFGVSVIIALGIVPWRLVAQRPTPAPPAAEPAAGPTPPEGFGNAGQAGVSGDEAAGEAPQFIDQKPRVMDPESRREISRLKAENARLKEELKNAERDWIVFQKGGDAAFKEKLNVDPQERLDKLVKRLQQSREQLDTSLLVLTDQHPRVQQQRDEIAKLMAELEKIAKQQPGMIENLKFGPLREYLKALERQIVGAMPGDLSRAEGAADSVKRDQQRELLQEEIKLAEQQLGYTQQKFEQGLNIRDEWLRSARELYGAKQALAQFNGDKADLKQIAGEQIKLIEKQTEQVLAMIKAGKLAPGSDLELRKEVIRIRREALNL